MSERLYYTNAYLTDFDATVTWTQADGGKTLVTLDRTAFYPTSGGQPFDTGLLNGLPVVEVTEREDGEVVHVVEGGIAVGESVRGSVDWTRRFDHMQQHTGQHVLSSALERLFRARTESFHLGSASATIDLAIDLPRTAIDAAEDEANRIVWENRRVSVRFAGQDEVATLRLRKEPAREGLLRLVDVEDFDLSACGGTHVASTASIGIVAVRSWERFKGGLRVEFVCGRRALHDWRGQRDILAACGRLLSVGSPELAGSIERMQLDAKEHRRTVKGLQERLTGHEAAALVAGAPREHGVAIVVEAVDGYDAAGLKLLACAVAAQPGCAVAVLSSAPPFLIVVARSPDVGLNASDILRALTTRFGGKGGGRPDLAQGGGLVGPPADVLDAARALIVEQIQVS